MIRPVSKADSDFGFNELGWIKVSVVSCTGSIVGRVNFPALEYLLIASVVESVYTSDLKSDGLTAMRVQFPPLAPIQSKICLNVFPKGIHRIDPL